MDNFVDLLKRASALWWRVKILWPLGMLAALVGYGDVAANSNVNFSQPLPVESGAELPPWVEGLAENQLLREFVSNPLPYIVGFILVVMLVAVFFALVGALAHGAMIRVADVADQGYAASLGDGLRVGAARMLPLFLLNLLLGLPVILFIVALVALAVFAILSAGAAFETGATPDLGPILASIAGAIFCLIALFLVVWLLGILLGILGRVGQRVCVIEGRGPVASLGRAWGLLRRNLGLTVLTWLLQAVLGSLVGLLVALPAAALAIPAIFSTAQGGALPVGLLLGLGAYTLLATVIVGGLLTAFNSALWTVMVRHFFGRDRPYESYGAA